MKGLKQLILEELENTNADQIAAEEYINSNYDIYGKLTFEYTNGLCIVNCDGDVKVSNEEIEKLTEGFAWGEVNGSFICLKCYKLKSLEGAPKEVGGEFNCAYCSKLKSLEGAPEKVDGRFTCTDCIDLTSL